ncbi:MAG: hypothetical protein EKK55_18320 [Rhodocyclaceae bacterium]|nr:MAG: hypothetical protein EKK55_18320 [Rhodocyclaceae bacterium]
MLTQEELVAQYLPGIALTVDGTPDGEPFDPSLFENAIAYATEAAETFLDICVEPRTYDGRDDPNRPAEMRNGLGHFGSERHDFHREMFDRLDLIRRPVRRVLRVAAHFPVDQLYDFPAESVQLHDVSRGLVRIIPTGRWPAILTTFFYPQVTKAYTQRHNWPDYFRVDYEAGFHPIELPLPRDIRHYIALKACFNILNPAGDLIVGAGIASKSISLDGLSQTVNTTSSAENSGYSSRLIQYEKELKVLEPRLRQKYGSISVMVV